MGEETELTSVAEGVTADEPSKDHHRKRKKLLHKSLLELMEFYLGDVNLTHDKFLNNRIEGKPFVYVDLSLFLTFNRIKTLTSDVKDLAKSVKHSEFLQLSEDETQICRITPIKKKENEDDCTIYVEQLGPDVNHEILTKVFSEFGPVDYISLPRYSHNGKFKGFGFVEFKDPECAKKALEVLSAKGCCLSPHMAPDELVSVKTFDVDDKNQHKEGNGAKEQSKKKKNKRKHSSGDMVKQSNDNLPKSNQEGKLPNDKDCLNESNDENNLPKTPDEEPPEKKMKPDHRGGETTEMVSQEEVRKSRTINKKRKLADGDGNLNSDSDIKEDVAAKKRRKSDAEGASEKEYTSHTDEDTADVSNTEEETAVNSVKQKKRKRKKKLKKDKVTASSLGLRVLSKKEWKRMRNKYLNMQREVMAHLKQQLSRPKSEVEGPKLEERCKPGTVIKVTLEEPVSNNTTTKSEFRIHPDICYVDVKEGSFCVYLRTNSPDLATSIVQTKHWPNMEIIQGDEETSYWEKIKMDRQEYFQQKSKRNQRGRTKLLKRAEKFQEKQI